MERNDYVEKYLTAYREMKEAAIEKMKNYGKTLDIYEVCKKRIMEREGYTSAEEIYEDDFDEYCYENIYYCIFEGKHGSLYSCRIVKIRYNKDGKDLDVYLEDDNYDVHEWFPAWSIGFDRFAIYIMALDFCD